MSASAARGGTLFMSLTNRTVACRGKGPFGKVTDMDRLRVVDPWMSSSPVAETQRSRPARARYGSTEAGAVTASSQSGRISVTGVPKRSWNVHSGSGGLDIAIDSSASFNLDAMTGSGSVNVESAAIQGAVSKQTVQGTVGSGGASVRLSSRSGSIHVRRR
jgi:hypothetical protein